MTLVPEFSFPCSADKKPRVKQWQRKLFQWQTWSFAPLVGVQTGLVNGFDVLDVDTYKPSGADWWDANKGRLPPTYTHHTRRGGKHLFFRHSPGLRGSIDKIADGVDVRADGNFVVWWPREGFAVEDRPLAEIPGWLVEEAMKGGRRINRNLSTLFEGERGERVEVDGALAALLKLDPRVFNGEGGLWFAFMNGCKGVGIDVQDFVEWSTGDPDYADHGEEITKRWHSVDGVHGGAFYATLKQAGIKVRPTHPHISSTQLGAEVPNKQPAPHPASPTLPFFTPSIKPFNRFQTLIAILEKDGRERQAFTTSCEIAGMVLIEGWPKEEVARKFLERACKVNGLRDALGPEGCKLTIDNAFAHIREKITAAKEALEAEDVS